MANLDGDDTRTQTETLCFGDITMITGEPRRYVGPWPTIEIVRTDAEPVVDADEASR